jgi:hypothetical protein
MGRWIAFASAAAFIAVNTPESVRAETPAAQLHVRVYDNTQRPHGQLAAALRQTGHLLAAVGLDVHWLDCSPAAQAPVESNAQAASCGEPLAEGELALRIVHVPPPRGDEGPLPLGDSLIDRRLGLGVLATIYYERVEWLARDSLVTTQVVLARAVAHEIAHLLIGSSEHAERGLMRPLWSRQDLQRNRSADWGFTVSDAEIIRGRRPRSTGSVH